MLQKLTKLCIIPLSFALSIQIPLLGMFYRYAGDGDIKNSQNGEFYQNQICSNTSGLI